MSLNLVKMDSSDESKTSMPVPISMATQLLSSTSTQSGQVNLLPRLYSPMPVSIAPYPYQTSFSSERAAQMGLLSSLQAPTPVYMSFPQFSSASNLQLVRGSSASVQTSVSVNSGMQVSASKKRLAQRQVPTKLQNAMAIQGSQQVFSMNKRPAQMMPPPKTESFESVRSKLRESLAASLAMVPDQQTKPQAAEKNSSKEAVTMTLQAEVKVGPAELATTTLNSPASSNPVEALTSEQSTNVSDSQNVQSDAGQTDNLVDLTEAKEHHMQENQTTHTSLENEMPFGTNPIMNDELLQGHGLCWVSDTDAGNSETIMNQDSKRPKFSHDEVKEDIKPLDEQLTGDSKLSLKNIENLANIIEGELFKLYGGVNKKYKEKARSLLFNLKDRSNPELRERVLSGDIAPERLCSMTAEELASKELSQWRLAKAEEFAQMVVLPDSDVDMRRLVKKTHKGEFQVVEIEQDDRISEEVAVGESILSRAPAKVNGSQTQSKPSEVDTQSSNYETKMSGDLRDNNNSSNLDPLMNEKTDLMQDLMVDELKDAEPLPPIVSLDEFMQALDSEPPFDNLSVGTELAEKNSDNSEPEVDPESESSELKSEPVLDNSTPKVDLPEDITGSKLSPRETDAKEPEDVAVADNSKSDVASKLDIEPKSSPSRSEPVSCMPDNKSRGDHIWEGLLQLNVSALATVIGYFRSGEKASTQDWPNFLEIKGRVRVDAFEKFLHELPLSRSRAIMIAQFCWKEGSHETGRLSISEAINLYVADQRLGFAEPSQGVELYFCPPHPKTIEMLEKHLPKDHTEPLDSNFNGLIGLIVWRRPHVTNISPRLSSHHKHSTGTKKQSSSRRHQHQQTASMRPSGHRKPLPEDEPMDDVPPGFGPGSTKDDDDLPEFDFVHGRSQMKGAMANVSAPSLRPPSRPVNQMRELIQKYGKGNTADNAPVQPWNNDDDDIPEWQPNHNNPPRQQPQQLQLPPALPPVQQQPPMLHSHNSYQQHAMPPPQQQQQQQQQQLPSYAVNPSLTPTMPQQPQMQHLQQLMPLAPPVPMPLQSQFHPQMGFMQGQPNVANAWQQGGHTSWPPAQGQAMYNLGMNLPINGGNGNGNVMLPPCNVNLGGQPGTTGQFYGAPAAFGGVPLQNGMMNWRPDVPRNSGN